MKFSEIKSVLIRKKFPPHTIKDEVKKIQKATKEISQDSGVPADKIAQMILENIKYVGSDSGT